MDPCGPLLKLNHLRQKAFSLGFTMQRFCHQVYHYIHTSLDIIHHSSNHSPSDWTSFTITSHSPSLVIIKHPQTSFTITGQYLSSQDLIVDSSINFMIILVMMMMMMIKKSFRITKHHSLSLVTIYHHQLNHPH